MQYGHFSGGCWGSKPKIRHLAHTHVAYFKLDPKVVPYGGPKNKNQFRIRPRFRRNQALWAKNTDADGFGICSPLVFDRSAEQIGRKPICPNLIGTGSSLIYQISYLFLNRNQSRIGPRRRQNHKAWPEIWTRTGTDPGLVPVFVKTIRNGLTF